MAYSPNRRPALFEEVILNEEITMDLECTAHWSKSFRYSVDDETGLYDPNRTEKPYAPMAGIAKELMILFLQAYDNTKTAGLHQREEVWLVKPVPLGAKLRLAGRYTEKYIKREKGYVTFTSEAYDEKGDLVLRQSCREVMAITPGIKTSTGSAPAINDRIEGVWPEGRETVASASPAIAAPAPLVPMVKHVNQDQMAVYSGISDHRVNIHNNLEKARHYGFKNCVMAGMMETCWQIELGTRFFGEKFLRGGHLLTIYTSPVFSGDIMTCYGVVTGNEKEELGNRLALEVWFENQDKQRTAVGRMDGLA